MNAKDLKALGLLRAYDATVSPKRRFRQMVKAGVIDSEGRPNAKQLLRSARLGARGRATPNSEPVAVGPLTGMSCPWPGVVSISMKAPNEPAKTYVTRGTEVHEGNVVLFEEAESVEDKEEVIVTKTLIPIRR